MLHAGGSEHFQRRLDRQEQAAQDKARAAAGAKERAREQLEDQIDRLTLVCMAMWSLLREKLDLSEEQLVERVADLDLLDGQLDGKVTRQVTACANCGRSMSPRHRKCLFCGTPKQNVTAFDELL